MADLENHMLSFALLLLSLLSHGQIIDPCESNLIKTLDELLNGGEIDIKDNGGELVYDQIYITPSPTASFIAESLTERIDTTPGGYGLIASWADRKKDDHFGKSYIDPLIYPMNFTSIDIGDNRHYHIQSTQVTKGQFLTVMRTLDQKFGKTLGTNLVEDNDHPVTNLSILEIKMFLKVINKLEKLPFLTNLQKPGEYEFRLPDHEDYRAIREKVRTSQYFQSSLLNLESKSISGVERNLQFIAPHSAIYDVFGLVDEIATGAGNILYDGTLFQSNYSMTRSDISQNWSKQIFNQTKQAKAGFRLVFETKKPLVLSRDILPPKSR